jgi:hypothetical protein
VLTKRGPTWRFLMWTPPPDAPPSIPAPVPQPQGPCR